MEHRWLPLRQHTPEGLSCLSLLPLIDGSSKLFILFVEGNLTVIFHHTGASSQYFSAYVSLILHIAAIGQLQLDPTPPAVLKVAMRSVDEPDWSTLRGPKIGNGGRCNHAVTGNDADF